MQNNGLFTTSIPAHEPRTRITGQRQLPGESVSVPVKVSGHGADKESGKVVLEALVRATLKEIEVPEISPELQRLPFVKSKKLEALRAIETYLAAQLQQVRKEIQKVTQESV